jgi:hypothetical protein
MKDAIGIILLILGWLGIIVGTPIVIMVVLFSGFASPREQPQMIYTAVCIPVVAVLALMTGKAITRNARSATESSKTDD